ncbi:hypothetical protein BJB45_12785 [Halomonas huangheensis]|uniref:Uncharacterized protein n=1 Tax=Halomonas huangheensis TaxID=1178482 RepID=W1N820_9GAMM|nr:hypothetical protein BJB45_12785 [Halomonas huangheensis]
MMPLEYGKTPHRQAEESLCSAMAESQISVRKMDYSCSKMVEPSALLIG